MERSASGNAVLFHGRIVSGNIGTAGLMEAAKERLVSPSRWCYYYYQKLYQLITMISSPRETAVVARSQQKTLQFISIYFYRYL